MAQTSNTSRDFTFSLHLLLKTALDAIGDRPWLQTELLANTCIEEKVFEKESPLGVGGDFHILRSKPSDLLKYVDSTLKPSMIHRFTLLQCNTVVLRTPKSNLDQQIAGGQRILDSLATEIQILKDERLKSHPNIVNLTGICWEFGGSLRQLAMPVMVLETAEAGDLSTYTQRTSKLGARDRLRLAIHCFEGLRAVHNVGVIHADIKPENVLIFTDTDSRPHAKLADFGCSVLLNEVDALIRLESGTPLWQSPRVSDALNAQQLRATDTYSLTLVTSLLLIGYPMYAVLEEVAKSGDDGKSLDELKAEEGALAALILRMQREANELQGTCFDKDVTALIAMFFRVEVSLDEEIAIGGTDLPLRLLRVMLHREIVIAVTRDARTHDTLDELEKDVYLCPGKDLSSKLRN
jgi:serine/threonine protein kinase